MDAEDDLKLVMDLKLEDLNKKLTQELANKTAALQIQLSEIQSSLEKLSDRKSCLILSAQFHLYDVILFENQRL